MAVSTVKSVFVEESRYDTLQVNVGAPAFMAAFVTNVLLKAAGLPSCAPLLERSIGEAKGSAEPLGNACDRFAVAVGSEILGLIPGRISTEVDARLSFDQDATFRKA